MKRYNEDSSVDDRSRSARPRSVRTPAVIIAVKARIQRNPKRKQNLLTLQMGLSRTTVKRVLNEDLGLPAYRRKIGHRLNARLMDLRLKRCRALLKRVVKEEGVLKLWRGATPTVARAMVVTAVQLATYSQAREMFIPYVPDGIALHFCAAMMSGLVTTIASMPVDIIKTKIQNAAKGQSQLSVVTNLLRNEGVLSLWKGFVPYYARLGPHTVLIFIFLEQFNAAYLRYANSQ
ncbi:hypothetical protein evm_007336 [Chilo suppressalis]|nr:hypothetical protein evm_007336 [Chilo suppressalis]